VPRHCGAGSLLLGIDRAGLGERCDRALVEGQLPGRVRDAVDRVGQVDRRRARGSQSRRRALEPPGVSRELDRQAVAGCDPDQRRAADAQPPDRLGDGGGAAELELDLAPRERRLVDRQ
jgi:hypothetical protein